MMVKSVCAPDCPGRTPECHSTCEQYISAREENLKRYAEREKEHMINDVCIRGLEKVRKSRKKKTKAR